MSNVTQFPDRQRMAELDRVGEGVRDLTRRNQKLTFAESIAILEIVKQETINRLYKQHGVDEE